MLSVGRGAVLTKRSSSLFGVGPQIGPGIGAVSGVYLILPLVFFVGYVLNHISQVSFANVMQPALVSLGATALATSFAAVFGIPLSYYLARNDSRLSTLLGAVVRIPLGVPPMVAGIVLLLSVGPYAPLGRLTGGHLVNSFLAVATAQAFVASPYVIEAARGAFSQLDLSSEHMGKALGLSKSLVYLLVAVPGAWGGIRTGLALGWLRAFGEFGATVLLAYHPYSLPILTYVRFGGFGLASTLGTVLVTVVLAGLGAMVITSLRFPKGVLLAVISTTLKARHASFRRDTTPLSKSAGGVRLAVKVKLRGFSLALDTGEPSSAVAILGYSGAGKSLAVSALFGVAHPRAEVSEVRLELDGLAMNMESLIFGWVPQSSGIFPLLSAGEQIELARSIKGTDVSLVESLIDRFEVRNHLHKGVGQLSGGEKQRVALVRALALQPRVLILDEPFSALDTPLRATLQRQLDLFCTSMGTSLILVTHDVEEALLLAERIVIISDGHVIQSGRAGEVYRYPDSFAAASLLGYENIYSSPSGGGLDREDSLGGNYQIQDGKVIAIDAKSLTLRGVDEILESSSGSQFVPFGEGLVVTRTRDLGAYTRVYLEDSRSLNGESVVDVPYPGGASVGEMVNLYLQR